MKLFEDMKELGGTIHDAVQQMVKTMFRAELDEEQIAEIIDQLSLSDILALDTAYSANNKEAVQNILGPLPQMEYNMGNGRQATSTASARPTTSGAAKNTAAKSAPAAATTSSAYSGGNQTADTTQSTYSGGNQKVAPVSATSPDKSAPLRPDDKELELEETEEYTDWVLCNNDDSPAEEVTETNIVEMQAWLKRRAGIIT